MRHRIASLVFVAFVLLMAYAVGAAYVEAFVNYPLWSILGPTEAWLPYHRALGPRVIVVLAIPAVLLTLGANALVLIFRLPAVPRWMPWATLVSLLVIAASTITIQVPIQTQFDTSFHQAALDRLIWTSFWFREVPGTAGFVLVAWMLYSVVRATHGVSKL